MFVFRLIRKFFSQLRSGNTPHEIGLGFCLGIWLGTIPLSSVWAALVPVAILLLFRSSFGAFLMAALLIKTLGFVLDPILYDLGVFMLEGPPGGFFQTLVNTPALALLDLHRYVIAGGLLFTLVLSVVCYPLWQVLVRKYRAATTTLNERSSLYVKISRFFLVRFLVWVFMGKKKKDYDEIERGWSPFRKGAIIVVPLLIVAGAGFGWLFGDAVAKTGFEEGMSRASDRHVTTEELALSFIRGSLDLSDLCIYEVDKEKGLVKALSFRGDLSMRELLRRHIVFDEVIIENMDFQVTRDEAGRLNVGGGRKKQRDDFVEEPEGDNLRITDLWRENEFAKDLLDQVLETLFSPPGEEDLEARKEKLEEQARKLRDFASLFADFLLEQDHPMVLIKDLRVRGLTIRTEDRTKPEGGTRFERLALHATNLSTNPFLYGRDGIIEIGNKDLADPTIKLTLTLNWSNPDPVHTLEIRMDDTPTDLVMGNVRPGGRLKFEEGALSLRSMTRLASDGLVSESEVSLTGAKLKPVRPDKRVLGVDAGLFCEALNAFLAETPLTTTVKLTGPYGNLKVDVDEKALVDAVREGARRASDQLLQKEIDKQLKRADALVNEKADEVKGKIDEGLGKASEKLDDATKKIDEVLDGAGLGGLTGPQKARADEEKKKLEEKKGELEKDVDKKKDELKKKLDDKLKKGLGGLFGGKKKKDG